VTVIYALEPLFAMGLAWAVAGEEITRSTLVGAAFIALACVWDSVAALVK